MNKLISILIASAVLYACRGKSDESAPKQSISENPVFMELKDIDLRDNDAKKEINNWIKNDENGFIKRVEIDGFKYSALWLPAEYNLLAFYDNPEKLSDEEMKEILTDYGQQQLIQLQIENTSFNGELLKYELQGANHYSSRMKYVSTDIQKDVYLICGNDTLTCLNSVFERGYDVNGMIRVQLVFPSCSLTEDKDVQLLFDDQLFNAGPLRMRFGKNNVNV